MVTGGGANYIRWGGPLVITQLELTPFTLEGQLEPSLTSREEDRITSVYLMSQNSWRPHLVTRHIGVRFMEPNMR